MKKTSYIIIGAWLAGFVAIVAWYVYINIGRTKITDKIYVLSGKNVEKELPSFSYLILDYTKPSVSEDEYKCKRFYCNEAWQLSLTQAEATSVNKLNIPEEVWKYLKIHSSNDTLRITFDVQSMMSAYGKYDKIYHRDETNIGAWTITTHKTLKGVGGNIPVGKMELSALTSDSLNLDMQSSSVFILNSNLTAFNAYHFDGHKISLIQSKVERMYVDLDKGTSLVWSDAEIGTEYVTGTPPSEGDGRKTYELSLTGPSRRNVIFLPKDTTKVN